MIADPHVIQHTAQTPQGNAHAIRTAEAAELAAAFHVRLQIEKHARHAPLLQLFFERGNQLFEVAQHQFMAAVAAIGWNKMLQRLLIDMRPRRFNAQITRRLEAVIMQCLAPTPPQRFPTARALAQALVRCLDGPEQLWPESLAVQHRMIDPFVQRRHQLAVLADQISLNL